MNVLRFAELTSAFNDAESGMTAQENADKITSIMLDASHGVYEEYSKELVLLALQRRAEPRAQRCANCRRQ